MRTTGLSKRQKLRLESCLWTGKAVPKGHTLNTETRCQTKKATLGTGAIIHFLWHLELLVES